MYWYPQGLFTAEQACRRRFCYWKRRAFFQTCPFLTKRCVCTDVCCLCICLKTQNRRGTNRQSKWRLHFVLSSHIDSIGDQHDVQYFKIFISILWIFGISGTSCSTGSNSYSTGGNIIPPPLPSDMEYIFIYLAWPLGGLKTLSENSCVLRDLRSCKHIGIGFGKLHTTH